MRIYLQISESKTIPFNYQRFLTGAIHKWLGSENELHGELALFSFSWLQNVESVKDGLKTKSGSYFFISAYDDAFIKAVIRGIQKDNSLCFGARVVEVQLAENPQYQGSARFQFASPIFIKRIVDGRTHHFEYSDPSTTELLTETLKLKMEKAGLDSTGAIVRFDDQFEKPRTKIISYGEIKNRVNLCPVIVEGSPEQIAFAWDVGVGSSSGIGFGALK